MFSRVAIAVKLSRTMNVTNRAFNGHAYCPHPVMHINSMQVSLRMLELVRVVESLKARVLSFATCHTVHAAHVL